MNDWYERPTYQDSNKDKPHANYQQREKPLPNDGTKMTEHVKFKLTPDWKPSDWVYTQLEWYGMSEKFTDEQLKNFFDYWLQPGNNKENWATTWNNKFIRKNLYAMQKRVELAFEKMEEKFKAEHPNV